MIRFTSQNRINFNAVGLVPDRWQMFRCLCVNTGLALHVKRAGLAGKMIFDGLWMARTAREF
jgi:hypothetical protein